MSDILRLRSVTVDFLIEESVIAWGVILLAKKLFLYFEQANVII